MTVEPIVDPKRPVRIWVAAPNRSSILVRDTVSAIDSVVTKSWGTVVVAPHVEGRVRATVGGTTATAVGRDSLVIKPVLVLGIASWEGKFILASLEEYGWKVDAHFGITAQRGNDGTVIQGPPVPQLDTAHYAAVIALDTSAAGFAEQIGNFVRQGGGFIATGDAASLPAFASLLPATATPKAHDDMSEIAEDSNSIVTDSLHPRRALALTPLTQLKPGAVALEMRDKQAAVVARRIGTGRILQVGYHNTWRWRGWAGSATPFCHIVRGGRTWSAASLMRRACHRPSQRRSSRLQWRRWSAFWVSLSPRRRSSRAHGTIRACFLRFLPSS